MVVTIKKIIVFILFIFFAFIFDISEIDSNSDKYLLYDKYEENLEYYTLYFRNINSHELKHILKIVKPEIIYYIINNKKYYVRNMDILYDKYTENMPLENKILYDIKGYKIDGIRVFSSVEKLSLIEKLTDVY